MARKLILTFAAMMAFCSPAWAQSVATSELFGEGVHRYFARDYQGADQLLTEAIDSGSQDPRAYYFRGLSRELIGGGGDFDFEEGARLEANGRSGPQISYSLARVQGQVRAKLEKARRTARVLAAQQRALQQKDAPPAVEIPQVPAAGSDPFTGEGVRSDETQPVPKATEPKKSDASDPFGDEQPKMDSNDPFGGSSKPAEEPAGDDPFK